MKRRMYFKKITRRTINTHGRTLNSFSPSDFRLQVMFPLINLLSFSYGAFARRRPRSTLNYLGISFV